MSLLEDSLAIDRSVPQRMTARADPNYEANTGMFGGWTSALLLKAVVGHPDADGAPSAMTVNFIERIVPGELVILSVARLGGGRSLTHWRSEVKREHDGALLATGSIVLAIRRDTDHSIDAVFPDAPPPHDLPLSNPPGPFGRQVETRVIIGAPPFNRPDMRSLSWNRETSGRAVDAVQLAFMADVYAPRVFHISAAPRPSSTVTLSITYLAGIDELAAVGDDYVLSEAEGTRIEQAQAGSRLRLWSPQGTLLATSEQLCWFR